MTEASKPAPGLDVPLPEDTRTCCPRAAQPVAEEDEGTSRALRVMKAPASKAGETRVSVRGRSPPRSSRPRWHLAGGVPAGRECLLSRRLAGTQRCPLSRRGSMARARSGHRSPGSPHPAPCPGDGDPPQSQPLPQPEPKTRRAPPVPSPPPPPVPGVCSQAGDSPPRPLLGHSYGISFSGLHAAGGAASPGLPDGNPQI